MKAKTDINIYHNTVVVVNQKALESSPENFMICSRNFETILA